MPPRRVALSCFALPLSALLAGPLATPAAAQWSSDPAQNTPVCTAPGPQRLPAAVSDGDGGMIVAWWDYRPGAPGLYVQRLDRMGYPQWGAGGMRVAPGLHLWTGEAASDGAGGMVLAWSDTSGGTAPAILAQRVSHAGVKAWGPAGVAVSTLPASAIHFQGGRIAVGADGSGGAAIAWADSGERLVLQVLDASGLRAWPAEVRPDEGPFYDMPRIASDGAGGVIACWRNATYGVLAQRVDATGDLRWGAGHVTLAVQSGGYRPNLVSDGRGGAIATWLESFPVMPYIRLMMQRLDSLGVPQGPAGGSQVSTGYAESDSLLSDGQAGAFLTWLDDGKGRVQHFDPSGSPLWDPSGVPFDTSYVYRGSTVLAASPDGGVHVSWYSYSAHGLRVQRLSSAGARLWGPAGLPLSPAAGEFMRGIVSDGLGGLLAAWADSRNFATTGDDIFAQRWNAQGALGVEPAAPPAARPLAAGPVPARRGETMSLRFTLAEAGRARLAIHDLAGRLVRVAASGWLEAGAHDVRWDGRDATGRAVPPGLYFARLETARRTSLARIVVGD